MYTPNTIECSFFFDQSNDDTEKDINYLSFFKTPPMITQVTPSQMTSKTVIVLQTVHLFQNQQNLQKTYLK